MEARRTIAYFMKHRESCWAFGISLRGRTLGFQKAAKTHEGQGWRGSSHMIPASMMSISYGAVFSRRYCETQPAVWDEYARYDQFFTLQGGH